MKGRQRAVTIRAVEGVCLFLVPLALIALVIAHGRAVRAVHREVMSLLAARLDGGSVTGSTGWLADPTAAAAEGRVEGLAVRVQHLPQTDPGRYAPPTVRYEVVVPHAVAPFVVERSGALDLAIRWLGIAAPAAPPFEVRRGAADARARLQAEGVRAALEAVVGLPGVDRVELRADGALCLEQRASALAAALDVPTLESTLRALVRLGHRCARVTITVNERPAARFAWTDGGASPRCPYCRDDLDAAAPDASACDRCGTVHHAGCLEEAGACTVFGCGARSTRVRA